MAARLLPALFLAAAAAAGDLAYAPAPPDNPLKGLVPYSYPHDGWFPWSMEFDYFPLGELMPGPDEYDWSAVDEFLSDAASRGRHGVFRVYLEYPKRKNVLPKWLLESGVKVTRWKSPDGFVETPDYGDPKLVAALERFVTAMGKKYDADPRVGYVTAGLLGIWGEWHNYPRGDDLWAPKETQTAVLDAFAASFKTVPVLLRYPTKGEYFYASTVGRPFGYHDDSFAWATMPTGREEDSWFYMARINDAGLQDVWKDHPIGGEVRPEVWGCAFDDPPCTPEGQSFAECVEATHATWLMETGLNEEKPSKERYDRAVRLVRRMGYEFHVPTADVTADGRTLSVSLTLENRGVAPFYREGFPVRVGLAKGGEVAWSAETDWSLLKLQPGESRTWSGKFTTDAAAGEYAVVVAVPPTFEGGRFLKFANETQDADAEGWLTLGRVAVGG